jgi:hypothetical protein
VKKFGVVPATAYQIYEWMQRSEIIKARLAGNGSELKSFF